MGKVNRKFLSIIVYTVMLIFLAWLGYTVVYGKGGIVERRSTEQTLARLEEEIELLEREIERADIELRNIRGNKRYLAQLARELGYKYDGELIFRFMRKKETVQD